MKIDVSIALELFYVMQEFFNRSDPESRRQENWWKKTDPFWSTAAVKDKKVSFFNWHDCQVELTVALLLKFSLTLPR